MCAIAGGVAGVTSPASDAHKIIVVWASGAANTASLMLLTTVAAVAVRDQGSEVCVVA